MLRMIAVLMILAASPALAQNAAPCSERTDFLQHLFKNYKEAPVAMGVTSSGRVLEVIASDNGSWTIIVTMPNGMTCGVVSGESWESLAPDATSGDGDPAA